MDTNYFNALKILTSQNKFYINLGLERISKLLELLKNPQDNLKCIHVAGTNGKGSVCSIISTILTNAGVKTGLYTSPHIFDYTERIKINNKDISKSDFTKYVFEIERLAEENNIELTEFEILTAVMFKYFSDNDVDVVVLETGLGGRFDATNVIKKNLCSIITHIDLDHTERLGNTKSQIAFEKAGIIKPNCPVFTSEGYEVIKDKADECNSLLTLVAPAENPDNLSLKGSCQVENLSLALAAVRFLFPQISEVSIQESLRKVEHPCRFQICRPDLVVDASHNPNGILALKESLDLYFPNKKRCFVFGCLRHKDYEKMMKILFNSDDEVYFYHFSHKDSCTIEELQKVSPVKSKIFSKLEELPQDKLKIICGSFYMLNEIVPRSLLSIPQED